MARAPTMCAADAQGPTRRRRSTRWTALARPGARPPAPSAKEVPPARPPACPPFRMIMRARAAPRVRSPARASQPPRPLARRSRPLNRSPRRWRLDARRRRRARPSRFRSPPPSSPPPRSSTPAQHPCLRYPPLLRVTARVPRRRRSGARRSSGASSTLTARALPARPPVGGEARLRVHLCASAASEPAAAYSCPMREARLPHRDVCVYATVYEVRYSFQSLHTGPYTSTIAAPADP